MPREEELDLDELLSVLGNPLRREILARLAKETHYPLQLSKELGVSQQAIMKQLLILKKYRLVRICEKKSTSLGPPRKCFEGTGQFSIRIDIGPSDFETRLILAQDKQEDADLDNTGFEGLLDDVRDIGNPGKRLRAFKDLVSRLNGEIETLEVRRASLMAFKQDVLREASAEISSLSRDYNERRLLYILTERPQTPVEELARMLKIHQEVLARMYRDLLGDSF
jgi:ArsR family transcriptional regulator